MNIAIALMNTREMNKLLTHASLARLASLAALLAFAGCGKNFDTSGESVYPVKGQVILANGKPLSSGKVEFLPKAGFGLPSSGDVSADGSFSLKTADGRDGAAAGEFKVRVVPSEAVYSKKVGKTDLKALPFAPQFMDADGDTGLTATIKPEPNTLEPFKLTPPASVKAGGR